jgi:Immunoglobulin domain
LKFPFQGDVDEISVYNRALSGAEIAAIYHAGSAGKCLGPSISAQPQSQVGFWGKSVTFTVTATGSGLLSYQWEKDTVPIAGATASSLTVTNLQMTDAGNYSVVITDSVGSITSSNAYLTMNPAGVSVALYAGITIDGVVGLTYGIQSNTDLSNTSSWGGIANVTLSKPTELWFDVKPANQPQRYYRVVPGPIAIP